MGIPSLRGVSGSDKVAADLATSVVAGTIVAVGPGKAFSVYGPMNLVLYGERTATLTTTANSLSASVGSGTGLANGAAIKSANVPSGAVLTGISGTNLTLALMPQFWNGTLQPDVTGIVMGALPADLSVLTGATIVSPYFATGTTVLSINATTRVVTTSNAPTGIPVTVTNILFEFDPGARAIVVSGADAAATFTGPSILFNATVQLERSFDGGATWVVCNVGGSGALAQWVGDGSTTGTPVSLAFGDPEAGMIYRLNAIAFSAVSNVALKYRISTTGQAGTSISLQTI